MTSRVSRGEHLLTLERRHEDKLDTQSIHTQAINACKAGMRRCKVLSNVGHAPNCFTEMFLKVTTACKNVSSATSAACAPPMKSSRKKATTPSSSMRAWKRPVLLVRRQVPRAKLPCAAHVQGNANFTCCTDSMLFGCSQAGHMRSCLSWLGLSINLLSCCCNMEVPERNRNRIKAAWHAWLPVPRCKYALNPGPS